MIYLCKQFNKIGQIQEIKYNIGNDKKGNMKLFVGHGEWMDIEEKIDIDVIKKLFFNYSVFIGYPYSHLRIQKTIIKIYNNRNEKF